jgi:L-aspartate oxidase
MNIPRNLTEPFFHKQEETDCVVVGGGIAGLYTALELSKRMRVTIITKRTLQESNTRWAQGGIAAVFSQQDSPALHKQDTLLAGAGLSDERHVDILVEESPSAVRRLMDYGVPFDKEKGRYALTQEGAHSRRRILHASGDATGAEIVRGLSAQVQKRASISVWEHHFTLDVLTERRAGSNVCTGVLLYNPKGEKIALYAQAVVLATGGLGQAYSVTTNPPIATGDGIAIALRAGAELQDMEFMQFHPTVLYLPDQQVRFLISEAVRGEGGILRNVHGDTFMPAYHPQAELAPRDIVSRAILNEMEKTGAEHVYLDITHRSERELRYRFPTIFETCLQYGINISRDWIPVAPAAHYLMGGVRTNEFGQTSISRLYACGEVACTGIHGANRLASNSLSEAIVFGRRVAMHIGQMVKAKRLAQQQSVTGRPGGEQQKDAVCSTAQAGIGQLQRLMTMRVGVSREHHSLLQAQKQIEALWSQAWAARCDHPESWEYLNLLHCAHLMVSSALKRQESRGGHYRADYPERNDQEWRKHLVCWRDSETYRIKEKWRHA